MNQEDPPTSTGAHSLGRLKRALRSRIDVLVER